LSARRSLPFLLAAWLAGCGGCGEGVPAPNPLADIELKDLSGRPVALRSFRGKVVLVDFWATYCEPCRDSIPELEKIYERRRAQGLEVVGIGMDVSDEGVQEFVKEFKMGYTVLHDPKNLSRGLFRLRGLPTAVLIDRAGGVRRTWTGYDKSVHEEIEADILKLLEEKNP
jgi:thiol-disulfide isomerase/thioredoxin